MQDSHPFRICRWVKAGFGVQSNHSQHSFPNIKFTHTDLSERLFWLSASFYLFSALYYTTLRANEGFHRRGCELRVCFWVAGNSFLLPITDFGDGSLRVTWTMFFVNIYWPCNPMSSAKSLRWWSGRILVSDSGKVDFRCLSMKASVYYSAALGK